jgi:hypothetical protein
VKQDCRPAAKNCRAACGMDLAVGLPAQNNWPLLIRSLIRSLPIFRGIGLSLASRLAANVEITVCNSKLKGLGHSVQLCRQHFDGINLIRFFVP